MTEVDHIEPPSPAAGERCGYPILRSLGAETELVQDERGATLVVKRLNDSCLLQGRLHPAIMERLERLRELPLRHVANFHGVQRDGERSFLVWSFIEGQPLEDYAADAAANERQALARELRVAVDALHASGLVHGAIQARNVIVDDRGVPHLTHVSPLLFYDPAIDEAAVTRMISETLGNRAMPTIVSQSRESHEFTGAGSIVLAIFIAALGIALAFYLYWRQR